MFWRLSICCAVLSLWLAACQTAGPPQTEGDPAQQVGERLVQRSQPLLGTFVTVSVYSADEERAQGAINVAFEEVRQVDLLLSIHKTNSEAAQINALAGVQEVWISNEMRYVLEESLEIANRTEGAFDPTIGPLTQLWGFIWKEYRLPSKEELDVVLPLVNFREVELRTNQANKVTAKFRKNGMFLDFGGIGKGYAVDRAIEKLRD